MYAASTHARALSGVATLSVAEHGALARCASKAPEPGKSMQPSAPTSPPPRMASCRCSASGPPMLDEAPSAGTPTPTNRTREKSRWIALSDNFLGSSSSPRPSANSSAATSSSRSVARSLAAGAAASAGASWSLAGTSCDKPSPASDNWPHPPPADPADEKGAPSTANCGLGVAVAHGPPSKRKLLCATQIALWVRHPRARMETRLCLRVAGKTLAH